MIRTSLYEGSIEVGGRTIRVASGFADLETDAWRQAGLRFWAEVPSREAPPAEIIEAAEKMAQWFAERNVADWALGRCASRSFAEREAPLARDLGEQFRRGQTAHALPATFF